MRIGFVKTFVLVLLVSLVAGMAAGKENKSDVKLSQPIAKYGLGTWNYGKLGNHRAVITVSPQAAKATAVKVSVPWRRRDDAAGESNVILVGPSGKTIVNRVATVNTRDKLDLVF